MFQISEAYLTKAIYWGRLKINPPEYLRSISVVGDARLVLHVLVLYFFMQNNKIII